MTYDYPFGIFKFFDVLIYSQLRKWWVESDFKAPKLPLSLRLKVSGCHYNSIYNNTRTKQTKQPPKAAPNPAK
jgi:hypothetical protein